VLPLSRADSIRVWLTGEVAVAVRHRILFSLIAAGAACVASPAFAQRDPVAELDALVGDTVDPVSGVAAARAAIGSGELTIAVATLERVLMAFPRADAALLLHASLLCRLDDRAGGRAEAAALKNGSFPESAWAEVTAACGAMPRPAGS